MTNADKTPQDYRTLAAKHRADGQCGTRANMVYACALAGRAERAAKILETGGTQEQAFKVYQGTAR